MTTFDPDTLEQDTGVLHRINREFGGRLALNCYVARPGTIAVGDLVELTMAGLASAAAAVSWIGVAIPASSAKRDTAPLRIPSPVGPPASKSTQQPGLLPGRRPSN